MAAVTYTPNAPIAGPSFTCSRCARVYPYPQAHGKPVRCECGWWYRNLGHGKMIEEWRPRIGGAKAPVVHEMHDAGGHSTDD